MSVALYEHHTTGLVQSCFSKFRNVFNMRSFIMLETRSPCCMLTFMPRLVQLPVLAVRNSLIFLGALLFLAESWMRRSIPLSRLSIQY